MSETEETNAQQTGPSRSSTRLYIVIAILLVVVIVVVGAVLATRVLPALKKGPEPTAVTAGKHTSTPVATFTPGPTREPTHTPVPSLSPTAPPVMRDTDDPVFVLDNAGARPAVEWTGFFGQVVDADSSPLAGVPLIVWYRDGTIASPMVKTGVDGTYEIRLAEAPLAGSWSIQVLSEDSQPASKLFTFNTDVDTESGIQQIQVIWRYEP